jgi:hypothetical protein
LLQNYTSVRQRRATAAASDHHDHRYSSQRKDRSVSPVPPAVPASHRRTERSKTQINIGNNSSSNNFNNVMTGRLTEQDLTEEKKDLSPSPPAPPAQPMEEKTSRQPISSSLSALFSPSNMGSVRSLASLTSQDLDVGNSKSGERGGGGGGGMMLGTRSSSQLNLVGKNRKNAILTPSPSSSVLVSPPPAAVSTSSLPAADEQHHQQQQQSQLPSQITVNLKSDINSRASVSTLMNELSTDFNRQLRRNPSASAVVPPPPPPPPPPPSLSIISPTFEEKKVNYSSVNSSSSGVISPSRDVSNAAAHHNHGITGLKNTPVNPNTINSQRQHRQTGILSPPPQLTSPPPSSSSASAVAAGRKTQFPLSTSPIPKKTPSTSNQVARIFGEDLAPIVSMGDYDTNGIPITTLNLGLKSKRIVKNVVNHQQQHSSTLKSP